ncbi:MAG: hypothetical protein RIS28_1569, partial [Bacteroidota bacterium]
MAQGIAPKATMINAKEINNPRSTNCISLL